MHLSPTRTRQRSRGLPALAALVAVAAGAVIGTTTDPAHAARPRHAVPTVVHDSHHDTSPPLRALGGGAALMSPAARTGPSPTGTLAGPTIDVDAEGLGEGIPGGIYGYPPDPNAAVGTTQLVEAVNFSFAVFDKAANLRYGPVSEHVLFQGFGGPCENSFITDGNIVWDSLADRWVFVMAAQDTSVGSYTSCYAVSATSDATGAWHRYSFPAPSLPDYPQIGVWPDAYYASYIEADSAFTLPACALDRARMLTGAAATQQCFTSATSGSPPVPVGFTGSAPPDSGAPGLFVATPFGDNATLDVRTFHVDWTTPANSSLSAPVPVAVTPYTAPTSGVPQPGTTVELAASANIEHRPTYRRFADHESVVLNHQVETAAGTVAERWYELRLSGGVPSLYQEGTYAPADGVHRWSGGIAMNGAGDIALGYTVSDATAVYPGIRLAARRATDPAGQLPQGEVTVVSGGSAQTDTGRWGDFVSTVVDPVDDCTFWHTNQYVAASPAGARRTRLASFRFADCTPESRFAVTVDPATASVPAGTSSTATVRTDVTGGSPTAVSLTASGQPAGVGVTFSPATLTSGGSSTMTVTVGSSTPSGTYPVTVTATGGAGPVSTTYTLTVTAPNAVVNGGFEGGSLNGWTVSGTASATTVTPHSGGYAALVGAFTATSGDSSIRQTFTAPSGSTTLSLWYLLTCHDTVTFDWATVTLRDNTAARTRTLLSRTCTDTGTWTPLTATLTAGHSYTLTLLNHDDGALGDETWTLYDDVTVS